MYITVPAACLSQWLNWLNLYQWHTNASLPTSVYILEEVNNYILYYTIVERNADTMHIHTKSNSRQRVSGGKKEGAEERESKKGGKKDALRRNSWECNHGSATSAKLTSLDTDKPNCVFMCVYYFRTTWTVVHICTHSPQLVVARTQYLTSIYMYM